MKCKFNRLYSMHELLMMPIYVYKLNGLYTKSLLSQYRIRFTHYRLISSVVIVRKLSTCLHVRFQS